MSYRIQYACWGWSELRAVLLSPVVSYREKLNRAVNDAFPDRQAHVANSARSLLKEVLRAAIREYPERNQVILPAYVCPSLLDPVADLGLEVIRAPVGDDLNLIAKALSPYISERTLAVICIHMYGLPADILEIEKICRNKNVILIDDAAQLGGSIDGERPLGTYGDFGLVSFAQSKSVVTGINGSGGVLLVNSDSWKKAFSDFSLQLPESRHGLTDILYFLCTYRYGPYLGKVFYYWDRLKNRMGFSSADKDHYQLCKISNIEAGIALEQFKSYGSRVNQKRKVLGYYAKFLENDSSIAIPQLNDSQYLTRVILKLGPELNLTVVMEELKKKGIYTRRGYSGVNDLIEIPCSAGMSFRQAKQVCSTVSATVHELSKNECFV